MTPTAVRSLIALSALLASFSILTPAWAADPTACSTYKDCAKGEFCDTTPQCPGEGVLGKCRRIPEICTKEFIPVTGCNGRVYPNRCEAAADSQPVNESEKQEQAR